MAQQARPKSMYHCEEARPQFSKSSTLVVKTVSGSELISGFMAFLPRALGLDVLYPFKIAFDPGVDQTEKENADEQQDFDQSENPDTAFDPPAKHGGHRKDERNFDFEDDKDQSDDVKTDIEVHPGAAHGGLAAFIGRQFAGLRIGRPQQLTDQQVDADKPESQ